MRLTELGDNSEESDCKHDLFNFTLIITRT